MNVNCNECNEAFKIDTKVEKHGKDIEEVYFICPNCNERYTAYFTDKHIRTKQKKVEDLYEEINKLKAELDHDMEVLKSKIEGGKDDEII